MSEPTKRKIAVRFEVVMEYEAYSDVHGDDDDAQYSREWLENEHCKNNVVRRLAEHVDADSERGFCNICSFAKVTVLPPGTEAYSSQNLKPEDAP
jgi:hypothetical protein